ncbi:Flp family type IVb pilin [Sphingomonas jatrophae]|uniref:Pilus assembly protein Flp/PilA n=1 Tax=Sphingomonas jatrophae TaxID=1166337 RepID=A0A1I6JSH4_9SPHN|nr:pilus assembly protein Flp/PilA [Sphingomonas jatrophae]
MFDRLSKLLRDRRGATAIEYGLILALCVLMLMAALRAMAITTTGMWNSVAENVSKA